MGGICLRNNEVPVVKSEMNLDEDPNTNQNLVKSGIVHINGNKSQNPSFVKQESSKG